jgi:hypothetical protein
MGAVSGQRPFPDVMVHGLGRMAVCPDKGSLAETNGTRSWPTLNVIAIWRLSAINAGC